jgi:guanylate cyclase
MEGGQIHPLTLRFRSRSLEAEYWIRTLPGMRQRTAVAVAVVLVLFTAFGFIDPWIIPEAVSPAWAIRAAEFGLCILVIALTRTRLFARAHQWILLGFSFLGVLAILLIMGFAGETGRLLYYVGLILAIVWIMLFSYLRFLRALAASVYAIAGYEVLAMLIRPQPLPVVVSSTFFLFGALVMCASAGYTIERAARVNFYQSLVIEQERQKSETLLLSILPREVSEILKIRPGTTIAQRYEQASILFADIVGFTSLSARMGAEEMVQLLNRTFSYFDALVEKYDLEKIRTIGDNYMVVAGVPRPCPDHACALARMALDMRAYAEEVPASGPGRLQFRIGINTGPVVAGVVGTRKFQYDVWGDAVNAASRMESHGVPGQIQITQATYELIKGKFLCEPRGPIAVKGIGSMETWLLVDGRRRRPAAAPPAG